MKKGTTLRGEIQKLQGVPKQYKQGWTEFYKLKFYLTPDVLIPRPETELLVDEVLRIVNGSLFIIHRRQLPINNDPLSIIDIGTGSGNIAIAVAKNLSSGNVLALDISEKALSVARLNAKFHNVEEKVIFLQSDLLTNVKKAPDILVTNLPYIPTARLLLIDPMVSEQEPRLALDGGIDGFELYRRLFAQMKEKNFYPKFLIAEIDEEQGDVALAEAKKYFPTSGWEVKKDLAKKTRILLIRT